MSRQPSASYTGLLLACPRPFDPELPDEPDLPGEPARYGSAFHQVIAACLRTGGRGSKKVPLEKASGSGYAKAVDKAAAAYDVRAAAGELAGHVKSSLGVLRNWLAREKLEVFQVETAWAVKPDHSGRRGSRPILSHDEDHKYNVEAGEVPGTVDLIAVSEARVVIIDHKTGGYATTNFARPSQIPQMKTLGLVGVRGRRPEFYGDMEVGIFHADRLGLPIVYAEPYERAEQQAHAKELHAALNLVGTGFLRTGPQCGYCPVRAACPAHRAELISEGTEALVRAANKLAVEPITGPLVPAGADKLAVEERAGLLYDLVKKFGDLEKAAKAEIKRLVREGRVIETRDGKTLVIRTQTFETLSMKSIRETLGAGPAEKLIAKLRKQGAVRESTREMLVGEK